MGTKDSRWIQRFNNFDKALSQLRAAVELTQQRPPSKSRAKVSHENGSDIDLTLCGGVDLTLNVIYNILNDLDDLMLSYTIDLSIFTEIENPAVVEHIERVGITFYQKGETAVQPSC